MIEELADLWLARRESELRERRGAERQQEAGGGPEHDLVFTDRLHVTLVRLRTGPPHTALAELYGIARSARIRLRIDGAETRGRRPKVTAEVDEGYRGWSTSSLTRSAPLRRSRRATRRKPSTGESGPVRHLTSTKSPVAVAGPVVGVPVKT